MCGISGIWDTSLGPDLVRQKVSVMCANLEHRGPDNTGTWQSSSHPLCLGHTRLSIQDLSSLGNQPMLSATGRYVLVFNGEMYNFKNVRKQLPRDYKEFRGGSDTEVILAACECWGIEHALKLFHGMFALAVYDNETATLKLARDRFGEKPLYFYTGEEGIYFSSELSPLLVALDRKHQLSKELLYGYFKYGYFGPEVTPFDSIKKLAPGQVLTINSRDIASKRIDYSDDTRSYWHLENQGAAGEIRTFDEAVDKFEGILSGVIENQLIADVNVGVFLSGGIDSTLVTAIAAEISDIPINSYTIAFDHETYNEGEYAAAIASHLKTNHHEIPVDSNECLDGALNLFDFLDEPFADSSILPSYVVCKHAVQDVKVCLSGDAGDEFFAGYNRYHWGAKLNSHALGLPSALRKSLAAILEFLPSSLVDRSYLMMAAALSDRKADKDMGKKIHKIADALRCDDEVQLYSQLLSFWADSPLGYSPSENHPLRGHYPFTSAGFVTNAMLCDQSFYLQCDNLFKVDRAAMASALEVRVPFLDHELAAFCNALPPEYKWAKGESKLLLKHLLDKYVPRSLMDRPKMGFSVPLNDWFKNELKSWSVEYINADLCNSLGISPEAIATAWDDHQKGRADNANALWTFITFARWHEKFNQYIQ